MRFEWDDGKNSLNVLKHGIDFADIPQVFSGPMIVDLDEREDYMAKNGGAVSVGYRTS